MTDRKARLTAITPDEGDRALQPHYMGLGATLYMPATRADLVPLLNQEKLPGLRSLVVCTEDTVPEREVGAALGNLDATLEQLAPAPLMRFVRPRNSKVLHEIVRMPGIGAIDGLVLPKVDETNIFTYAEAAAKVPWLTLMPTIETEVAFDRGRLERLRALLAQLGNPVLCVRIGGNDLLQLLGLKRPKHMMIYDTPLRTVINDMIVVFRPAGYELSSPVFEHLDHWQTLRREVEMDIVYGLWSKTAIHPTQVGMIEAAYRVSEGEYAMAEKILAENAPAVFKMNGQMCEPTTHRGWATRIRKRAELYGVHG
ncbi:MAG TPA: HpcH/HpaI aldolase/citrate lyase family protein [Nitrococcus sp.]|nr:HpcH/HpaI aldolase/citrate lyase family protein [Nitrococcus sp.]